MSELTKEWLQQTIAELEEERDATPGAVNEDVTMALAAMKLALASLEAEPVAVTDDMAYAFHHALSDSSLGADEVEEIKAGLRAAFANVTATPAPVAPGAWEQWIADVVEYLEGGLEADGELEAEGSSEAKRLLSRRAAMLQGAEPVTTANKLPAIGWLRADYQDDNRGLRGNAPLFVLGKKDPSTVWGLDYVPLTSNSPVIPDGWVMVPEEPTHEMLEAGDEQFGTYDVYRRMIAASPQQEV
ncbi:hypothetical protein SS41_13675 [Enterobacter hormaechei subsp. xiangfangensis]|uniref:hypothetical protein n=1 Tax=Enterobacter cloacae complex TaxID=354276 RepID=UPI0005EEC132|nr:hypothetical protein [Enterobacter hormaechei]EMB8465322.1 hypothetical protein [Enterobacter hormaechei]KJN27750.1 hypothetical protein SS41_13675 [Enterobacter hormaechei subsp. xiangfangensis]MCE1231320.1 hypothetical protein [Enterobacter hormaechei]MCE1339450.1 hypothetical protein [Enterobacter hormaechei]